MALAAALDAAAEQRFSDMNLVSVNSVLKVINAGSSSADAIRKAVQELDDYQHDTLMKVLYVGMAKDFKQSSTYFKWHAALYEIAGAGTIVRVIADKPPKVAPV